MNSTWMLMRAMRGPVILITIGILFAIDHFGPYGFERTWPVLVIVIGLMKLLERMVLKPHPAVPVPPRGV
jgi:hypothetical protein